MYLKRKMGSSFPNDLDVGCEGNLVDELPGGHVEEEEAGLAGLGVQRPGIVLHAPRQSIDS